MNQAEATMTDDERFLRRTTEAAVRLGFLALLAAWCFQIVAPFIIPVVWGIIIATSLSPAHQWLSALFGGRTRLAAILIGGVAVAIILVPSVLSAGSFVDSAQWLVGGLRDGTLEIPPPPEAVAGLPVIGKPVYGFWELATTNLESALTQLGPYLAKPAGWLASAAAGAGLGLVQFLVSIVIAVVLLVRTESGVETAVRLAERVAGPRGREFARTAGATVRGVAQGILGVAVIQSTLIGIGLIAAGVPHAALWTALCLLLAIVQLPPLIVVLPIIVYVASTSTTLTAVAFTLWMALAGGSDNVLKPILLSRGVEVPMAVMFVGSIGGFMSSGFIGLFVGAVVLALGYELFMTWLAAGSEPDELEAVDAGA